MKYCTNCGNKLNEEADICIKCGKFINRVPNTKNSINSGEVFSIVGMILGIFGFLIILLLSLGVDAGRNELMNESLLVKIFAALFIALIPLAPTIPGLVFSIMGTKKKKPMYGIIGLVLSLLSLLFIIGAFAYIIW